MKDKVCESCLQIIKLLESRSIDLLHKGIDARLYNGSDCGMMDTAHELADLGKKAVEICREHYRKELSSSGVYPGK